MALNQSQAGRALYYPGPGAVIQNTIKTLATRQPSSADDAAKYFQRYAIFSGFLYADIAAAAVTAATDGSMDIFVAGCAEVTLQPSGTPGAISVQGSLDGTTFVAAVTTVTADGFVRITTKYKWLRVSVGSGTFSLYMMIS
jgi:hypothetical protein